MLDTLLELDKQLLLWLNGFHAPWLDPIMLLLTKTIAWLPLFGLLLYVVIKDYRKESWRVLLAITLTIVLADQLTSSVMKPFFARLRPSRDPELTGLIHLVNGFKSGLYGFASSHAANSFGVAMLFWLLYKQRRKWIWTLFIWAGFLSYTRIYLGVHFPGDIVVGALVGMGCALLSHYLYTRFLEPTQSTPT
ncbi:MAG: phosphatase PAP2 family protein [Cyclobacteriaceae bacterium]|nr:phosphatase PAP2 family protein [Cyclobacteriaceae bacterium]